ncbi:nitrile hydratase subunit alpha [Pseudomonas viridiflava]|uniref:nitrile hydratase subunit alpha n=1 Tax=Pseudomonas viridiflava TaxID=33069 RepID=UPI000F0224A4|nr:nitrile hydratase subunit alpha [Pseudomonas viridiflava]
MSHEHSHDHDHDDDHTAPPSEMELRVKALETLLVEKGIVNTDAIDELIQTYEFRIGPKNGAKVVARAWIDPEYKKRLLTNSTAAIAELGFSGVQGEDMTVVENTDSVHNVTVCTLCSCYPWPTLGLPPTWYKSAAYRSRVVLEPRAVLKEFGLEVSAHKEVRVWDSNADLRYLVLPQRPAGTDDWTEEQLIELVTRDSMIGVGVAAAPTL